MIQLDAPDPPCWRVTCDRCRDRRYLQADDEAAAAARAERVYGWTVGDEVLCRTCRREVGRG